jgi:thiosulfate reductase cytochrome b subunit
MRKDQSKLVEIYRHPLPVRIFHWVNAASFIILLMSGLQIFNYHPRLYWGHTGYWDRPAVFEISGDANVRSHRLEDGNDGAPPQTVAHDKDSTRDRSWIAFGSKRIDTTGVLGEVYKQSAFGDANIAFPNWMTLPPRPLDLARGRGWHFLALYVFAFNLAFYTLYGLISRRFRTLRPTRDQLRPRAIVRDLWMHLRLKHATGAEAANYNLLQKLSYMGVLFVLMPTMILTGMTMSPSALAAYPWLLDLFDGRQSARTIHFVGAFVLVIFVLVHVFQVFVAGFRNEMRSMITGKFRIPPEES